MTLVYEVLLTRGRGRGTPVATLSSWNETSPRRAGWDLRAPARRRRSYRLASVAEGLDSLDQWGRRATRGRRRSLAPARRRRIPPREAAALRGARLAPSIDPSLNDPETVKYRETYRRHRRQGTEMLERAARRGALRSTPARAGPPDPALRARRADVVEEPSGGVHGMNEMYEDEKGYSRLLRWRLAYQAHRLGKARGAQGEMGASLTLSDVQMLPVARLAAYYRQTRLRARARPRADAGRPRAAGARARGRREARAGARAARAGARRGGEQGRDRAAAAAVGGVEEPRRRLARPLLDQQRDRLRAARGAVGRRAAAATLGGRRGARLPRAVGGGGAARRRGGAAPRSPARWGPRWKTRFSRPAASRRSSRRSSASARRAAPPPGPPTASPSSPPRTTTRR